MKLRPDIKLPTGLTSGFKLPEITFDIPTPEPQKKGVVKEFKPI